MHGKQIGRILPPSAIHAWSRWQVAHSVSGSVDAKTQCLIGILEI
jgi:hypothetical protein